MFMKSKLLLASLLLLTSQAFSQYSGFAGLKWKFKTEDKIFTSPAITGNYIYIGSTDGNLYAIDKSNGNEIWRFKAQSPITASPLEDNGKIYFGCQDGNYYAVDTRKGTLAWKFRTNGERRIGRIGLWGLEPAGTYMEDEYDLYFSSPTTDTNSVYFGSSDSCLYALNKNTGKLQWKYKTNGPIHAGVSVSDNKVIACSWDTWVYALDTRSGKESWKFKTKADTTTHLMEGMQSAPEIKNGIVYISCRDANLYALQLSNGQLKWNYNARNAWIVGKSVATDKLVYTGTSDSYLMLAIDTNTGKEIFRHKCGGYIFGSPAISGNTLCYGDFTGTLHLLNSTTGQPLDKFTTPGHQQYGPTVLDTLGRIKYKHIAAGKNLSLYSTNIAVMNELYKLGPLAATPVIKDDVVYVNSADGYLYAIALKK